MSPSAPLSWNRFPAFLTSLKTLTFSKISCFVEIFLSLDLSALSSWFGWGHAFLAGINRANRTSFSVHSRRRHIISSCHGSGSVNSDDWLQAVPTRFWSVKFLFPPLQSILFPPLHYNTVRGELMSGHVSILFLTALSFPVFRIHQWIWQWRNGGFPALSPSLETVFQSVFHLLVDHKHFLLVAM